MAPRENQATATLAVAGDGDVGGGRRRQSIARGGGGGFLRYASSLLFLVGVVSVLIVVPVVGTVAAHPRINAARLSLGPISFSRSSLGIERKKPKTMLPPQGYTGCGTGGGGGGGGGGYLQH
eukprot:CAMPEP_0183314468 /NCGR_PEP_ID=MMETSP0160_2-20130417/48572_1 /TAXON_ID=2839 ORGANISM="Odontella Sinensis, Strain Grunow 1884" /NCGR_SAMPLE_ID=MMETSP0160_2 /ASSEMBLY_ACC=CAM_ASM_000250 /LENGTH=121 /DNA_ID=CAMNT_0025479813 /DNA_START=124 /DNA_END=487 /DNA_ORIENTATION=-